MSTTPPEVAIKENRSSSSPLERKGKKRKVVVNRPGRTENRTFHQDWKKGREWLQYNEGQGMWCSVCYAFRQHPTVVGPKSKRNALAFPTKIFRYRNVYVHPDTSYHLAAMGLHKGHLGPLSTVHINLPVEKIDQAKALFRTVLFMARRGIAHRQMRALMELQVANGIKFDMKYRSSYTPVIMHYLAQAAHEHMRKVWEGALTKAIMTDEVKIGDTQWLTTTARLFGSGGFSEVAMAPATFPKDDRDATAVNDTLNSAFKEHNIRQWLDDTVVGVTVDGASVLLSGLGAEIEKKNHGALMFYCTSHRTERVDFDVTEVPKAERADEPAMFVRKLAKRLNTVLSKTARFFSVSTKRWASLRQVAGTLGYHLAHGPAANIVPKPKRLLKYKCIQRTRFVRWKRWAAHAWLNNLPALQKYLSVSSFPQHCRKRARTLLHWAQSVTVIGGMHVYEALAAALTTLSLCTQSRWAVLPTLLVSVRTTQQRLQRLHETLEKFILEIDFRTMTYKGSVVQGSQADLDNLAMWTNNLKMRASEKLAKRFDVREGTLLWGTSLFDRRTWPQDLQFDLQHIVSPKISAIEKTFPRAVSAGVIAEDFVVIAQKLMGAYPLVRSKSGRIRACDALKAWEFAANMSKDSSKLPVVNCAIVLCTVSLSQASCERFNSIMKIVHGQHRQLLSKAHACDEIVVRTTTMPTEDMVLNAVRLWAAATVRRTALRTATSTKVNEPDSSSEGVSGSVSDDSNSSESSMRTSTKTSSSFLSDTSEGSLSAASVSLPQFMGVADVEREQSRAEQQTGENASVQCPWFEAKVLQYASLRRCAAQLRKEGFDSKETIVYLTVEDMANMEIPIALRRLLQDIQKEAQSI